MMIHEHTCLQIMANISKENDRNVGNFSRQHSFGNSSEGEFSISKHSAYRSHNFIRKTRYLHHASRVNIRFTSCT